MRSLTNRIAIVVWVSALAAEGHAQEVPSTGSVVPLNSEADTNGEADTQEPRDLYLEVFINGTSMKIIGNFKELLDGGLVATPEELTEVGLKPVETARTDDGLVRLDRLPDVSYEVDEGAQRLHVTADNKGRAARVIDIGTKDKEDRVKPQSGYGAVLNYSLFGSSNTLFKGETRLFQGISGGFDGRVFSPYGTLSQSFITGYSDGNLHGFTRLNTAWSYSDPDRLLTYKAGDFISGGLSWTRPVYLGGIQAARNFRLRSDLVTLPLPSFEGTAAVPSTIEVYTQNARTYTGNIGTGPFQIVNMPVFTGTGEARVVLRDALGRETATTLPFYSSSMLLRQGLFDFSADVGFPRRNFGIESNGYDDRLMGVVTARYGLRNWLTLESHFEGGEDLINGGAGVAFPLGTYGVASVAVAGSYSDGRTGSLVNTAIELSYEGWSLYGRIQRVFNGYEDIASVTAEPVFSGNGLPIFSAGVPRELDQVSLSVPAPLDLSSLSFSYTNLKDAEGERSQIGGISYSQQIFRRSTIYATAFKDLKDKGSYGVFAGISVPLNDNISASTGVESGPDGTSVVADLIKSEHFANGSVGWRLRTSEGKVANRSAGVSYRAPFGRTEAGIQQYRGETRATAQMDGAIAVAGGGVFATNRIDDAFAVVNVGTPDVDVQFQNRPVGKTNRQGRILVQNLNSYEPNTISIDPTNLPVDADVPATKEVVVPAGRSGVIVEFGVSERTDAALVSFVDTKGTPLEAGIDGKHESSSEAFVIGYDGEAYIRGLAARNSVTIIRTDGSACYAQFPYKPSPGKQVRLKNVVCQ